MKKHILFAILLGISSATPTFAGENDRKPRTYKDDCIKHTKGEIISTALGMAAGGAIFYFSFQNVNQVNDFVHNISTNWIGGNINVVVCGLTTFVTLASGEIAKQFFKWLNPRFNLQQTKNEIMLKVPQNGHKLTDEEKNKIFPLLEDIMKETPYHEFEGGTKVFLLNDNDKDIVKYISNAITRRKLLPKDMTASTAFKLSFNVPVASNEIGVPSTEVAHSIFSSQVRKLNCSLPPRMKKGFLSVHEIGSVTNLEVNGLIKNS